MCSRELLNSLIFVVTLEHASFSVNLLFGRHCFLRLVVGSVPINFYPNFVLVTRPLEFFHSGNNSSVVYIKKLP